MNRAFAELPLVYLITDGAATNENFETNAARLLDLLHCAVAAGVSLVQIREKQLSARLLFELTVAARDITINSETRILVNDRADIALAARADGVHLAAASLPAATIRNNFPRDFIIGVSCHSRAEVENAPRENADFAVFSPIFATPSKAEYGEPQGVERLRAVCSAVKNFPVIALGGIDETNFKETLNAGASGVAAIRLFGRVDKLPEIVRQIKNG